MPKRYEGIRDSLVATGMALKEAKTRAAKIFNATRKEGEAPVTGKHKKKKKKTKPGAVDDDAMKRARERKRKMKRIIEEE